MTETNAVNTVFPHQSVSGRILLEKLSKNKMNNEINMGKLSATPKVASPLENELQGLQKATEQLNDTVNALYSRLIVVLRQSNPETIENEKDQVELSPIPQSIRVQKESVLRNVFAIRDLLDRLEL